MSRKAKSVPKFKSEAEERAFWEKPKSTEIIDWDNAERVRFPNSKSSAT